MLNSLLWSSTQATQIQMFHWIAVVLSPPLLVFAEHGVNKVTRFIKVIIICLNVYLPALQTRYSHVEVLSALDLQPSFLPMLSKTMCMILILHLLKVGNQLYCMDQYLEVILVGECKIGVCGHIYHLQCIRQLHHICHSNLMAGVSHYGTLDTCQ